MYTPLNVILTVSDTCTLYARDCKCRESFYYFILLGIQCLNILKIYLGETVPVLAEAHTPARTIYMQKAEPHTYVDCTCAGIQDINWSNNVFSVFWLLRLLKVRTSFYILRDCQCVHTYVHVQYVKNLSIATSLGIQSFEGLSSITNPSQTQGITTMQANAWLYMYIHCTCTCKHIKWEQ